MDAPPPLLLALLALVSAAAGASSPVTEASPATLVVLRSACAANDRKVFANDLFQRYAEKEGFTSSFPGELNVLSFNDTCGEEWPLRITQAGLAALGGGRLIESAGWPGTVACGALVSAARALRRPVPAQCSIPPATAAAVVKLALTLRWRRAYVPHSTQQLSRACALVLRKTVDALVAGDVIVQRSTDSAPRPHVVILCASRRSDKEMALKASEAASISKSPVLLIILPDVETSIPNQPTDTTEEAYRTNNINLNINNNMPYVQSEKTSPPPSRSTTANLLSDYMRINKESFSTPKINTRRKRSYYRTDPARNTAYNGVNRITKEITKENSRNDHTSSHRDIVPSRQIVKKELRHSSNEGHNLHHEHFELPRIFTVKMYRDKRKSSANFIDDFANLFPNRLLILAQERIIGNSIPQQKLEDTYDRLLGAIENQHRALNTRIERIRTKFFLYQRTVNSWSQLALLETKSKRSLDILDESVIEADIKNTSASLENWLGDAENSTAAAVGLWIVLILILILIFLLGAIATSLVIRRRHNARRLDVVLHVEDFSFPVNEQRRVGEGMETMLSCWLQQLHEFGGPELERPDLLKQPSAPSSTCSVNRLPYDRRIRYKGEAVQVRWVHDNAVELKHRAADVLRSLRTIRHDNLNIFIGCICSPRTGLTWEWAARGSLEDVLVGDDIRLDWTFRLSLMSDLVRGMRYLHASPLRVHGRLTSRNCVVDSRWVLRVTDYGTPQFYRAQGLTHPRRDARELLWTAPELLRSEGGAGCGTQSGDVFSFAIIMQEVIVRGEPYCMLALSPDEIVEKVRRPPPLCRPSVSMGAAPPEAVSVMRQCWSEAPEHRPDFQRLYEVFRDMHRGRKINIVDSMFEMLEKYSNNLEELIRERTEQLDAEKKKTEQLLNRMLPRPVAERLVSGCSVEPELFEEVSIYFSDIVGFTSLAARSRPEQVVALLNDLYTTFDAAIEQYSVYKVETIGDAYMVVGGLPQRATDHAESIATMALHLLHLAGCFRIRHLPDTPLHLRIGLHSGPCCAGVVGLTMPRYCLFGDTVNTASRMESTGAAWRIQVSAATAARLTSAGGYQLRSRGLMQIKGKGAMHTYWLLGKDGFDKHLPTPPPLECEELHEEKSPPLAQSQRPITPSFERQQSDPCPTADRYAWGAAAATVSADSSPPDNTPPSPPPADRTYSRYRCLGGSTRMLRRQWSLEAAPVAEMPLLAPALAKPQHARYRTRALSAAPSPFSDLRH